VALTSAPASCPTWACGSDAHGNQTGRRGKRTVRDIRGVDQVDQIPLGIQPGGRAVGTVRWHSALNLVFPTKPQPLGRNVKCTNSNVLVGTQLCCRRGARENPHRLRAAERGAAHPRPDRRHIRAKRLLRAIFWNCPVENASWFEQDRADLNEKNYNVRVSTLLIV